MPNLIDMDDFHFSGAWADTRRPPKYHAPHYFSNARYNSSARRYIFDPIVDYPHECFVHRDVIENNQKFWIILRRMVERQCSGDVLYTYVSKDYEWWWNADAKGNWDRKYTSISHGYWRFWFECESDLFMFRMIDEIVTCDQMEDFHPDYGRDILQQRELA